MVFLFYFFLIFSFLCLCARLGWPSRQLLSTRKYTVSYMGVVTIGPHEPCTLGLSTENVAS